MTGEKLLRRRTETQLFRASSTAAVGGCIAVCRAPLSGITLVRQILHQQQVRNIHRKTRQNKNRTEEAKQQKRKQYKTNFEADATLHIRTLHTRFMARFLGCTTFLTTLENRTRQERDEHTIDAEKSGTFIACYCKPLFTPECGLCRHSVQFDAAATTFLH